MRKAKYLTFALALAGALSACGGGGGSSANKLHFTGNASAPIYQPDKPFTDPVVYGSGPDDSVTDASEGEAISYSSVVINDTTIDYQATTGHLVTVDPNTSKPNAKMFYIAFTANNKAADSRPVTFIYNGGPGSASVWLLLGSFAPKRIKTSLPAYTPPAPSTLEANPDSLLDKSDLVFINPVGTGYSAAISPSKNKDFWGVDQDAMSITGFIQRYLSKNNRWNSPKYLMGESYGTPRSAVTSFYLHQAGIDLNGITLISSVLDYRKDGYIEGLFPTLAANAWYHHKTKELADQTLPEYMEEVKKFSKNYALVLQTWEKNYESLETLLNDNLEPGFQDKFQSLWDEHDNYNDLIADIFQGSAETDFSKQVTTLLNKLNPPYGLTDSLALQAANYTGLDASLLKSQTSLVYRDRPSFDILSYAATNLLSAEGKQIGIYDGRATGIYAGIVKNVGYMDSDPSLVNIQSAYISAWNFYLNEELKYNSTSAFKGFNSAVKWDYSHLDPAGEDQGGSSSLYTAGDLAATMTLNPDLKVFQASGYFDGVTPFNQTNLDLAAMDITPEIRKNIEINVYPSGHMIYLDGDSRTKMKRDLSKFYDSTTRDPMAMQRILKLQRATLRTKSAH